MVVDAFSFYNEFDMLECRLEYLYEHVDYFVISECNFTHSGNPKPLLYLQEQIRYKKYAKKILYCPLILKNVSQYTNVDGTIDCFAIEAQQRENILTAVNNFDENTILIISDVDEIPNETIFENILIDVPENNCKRIYQKLFYYNLKYRYPRDSYWSHPYAIRLKTLRDSGVELNRRKWYYDDDGSGYKDGGWHLSYFMTPEQIKKKIEAFSHQELNTKEIFSNLEERVEAGYVFFENLKLIPTEKQEFPDKFYNIFGKYYSGDLTLALV